MSYTFKPGADQPAALDLLRGMSPSSPVGAAPTRGPEPAALDLLRGMSPAATAPAARPAPSPTPAPLPAPASAPAAPSGGLSALDTMLPRAAAASAATTQQPADPLAGMMPNAEAADAPLAGMSQDLVAAVGSDIDDLPTTQGVLTAGQALGDDDWVAAGDARLRDRFARAVTVDWDPFVPEGVEVAEQQETREPSPPVETTLHSTGYDVGAMRSKLARYKMRKALSAAEMASESGQISNDEYDAIVRKSYDEAHAEVRRMVDHSNNIAFVFTDTDPEGTDLEIVEGFGGRLASPLRAWLKPYTHVTDAPEVLKQVGPDGEITETLVRKTGELYDRQGVWGYLTWMWQGLTGLASTAVAAGDQIQAERIEGGDTGAGTEIPYLRVIDDAVRGYGTLEHVQAIRRGTSVFEYGREIARSPEAAIFTAGGTKLGQAVAPGLFEAAGIVEDQEQGRALIETIQGAGIGLALSVVEPDAVFGTMFAVGRVAKAGQRAVTLGATVPRLEQTAATLASASERVRMAEEAANAAGASPPAGIVPRQQAAASAQDTTMVPQAAEETADTVSSVIDETLQALPPEVRSSLESDMLLRVAWDPALGPMTEAAMKQARQAQERLQKAQEAAASAVDEPAQALGSLAQEASLGGTRQVTPAAPQVAPRFAEKVTRAEASVTKAEAAVTKAEAALAKAQSKAPADTLKARKKALENAENALKPLTENANKAQQAAARAEAAVVDTQKLIDKYKSLVDAGKNLERNERLLQARRVDMAKKVKTARQRNNALYKARQAEKAAQEKVTLARKKADPAEVAAELLSKGQKKVAARDKALAALATKKRALAAAQAEEQKAKALALRAQQAQASKQQGFTFEQVIGEEPQAQQLRQSLAEAELALAEQEHLAHVLVLDELQMQLRAVQGLGVRRGAAEMSAADEVLAATARTALQDALESRLLYYQSTDSAKGAAALRENQAAMQKFHDTAKALVGLNGSRALRSLDDMVDAQKLRARASGDTLRSVAARLQKAQDLPEGASGRINLITREGNVSASSATALVLRHERRLRSLKKAGTGVKLARGQNILSVLQQSLAAHAKSYKALASGLKNPPKRAPLDLDTELRAATSLLPDPEDGVVTLTALPREVVTPDGRQVVEGTAIANNITLRLKAQSGLSEEGIEALRKHSPLFRDLERLAGGVTDDVVIEPNAVREMVETVHNFADVERMAETSIAVAGELRRPYIEFATAAFAGTPWRQMVHKGFLSVRKMAKILEKPHLETFGAGRDDMLQIAKGATDAQRYGMFELAKAYDEGVKWARSMPGTSRAQGIRAAAIAVCDGAEAGGPQVSSVLVGAHTGTLWSQARAFMVQMAKSDEMNASMDALMRAWLPSGVDTERFLAMITATARATWAETKDVLKVVEVLPGKTALTTPEQLKSLEAGLKMYELVLSEEALTFAEFMEKMKDLTALAVSGMSRTRAGTAMVQKESSRAYGIASQAVMHGAILHRMSQQIAGKLAGFDAAALTAAMHVTEGLTPQVAGSIYAEASAAMVRMGVPPRLRKVVSDAGEDIQAGLIMLNKVDSAEAALLPRKWLGAMDAQLGRIVKETADYATAAANPMQGMMRATVSRMARLFRMSITSGIIWHSPRYLTSMMAGNMSQIFADPRGGARAAAGSAAQLVGRVAAAGTYAATHGTFSPLRMAASRSQTAQTFRQGLDRLHAVMVGKFGPDRALPSSMTALYNPHVANFFDPQAVPASATIRTAAGDVVTMGYLREQAYKQGVLTTYASTDLMDVLARTADSSMRQEVYAPGGIVKAAAEGFGQGGVRGAAEMVATRVRDVAKAVNPLGGKGRGPLHYLERRGAAIADFADSVEQRQRAALFLDHVVNRGYSPEKAGALVRESLYDWGHGVTKFEAEHLNDWFLFWRFLRLSQRQGVRIMGNGFVRGYRADDWSGALKTNLSTSTGRMAIQVKGQEALRSVAGYQNRLAYEDDEYRAMYNDRYPWWASTRATPFILNQPLSEEMVAFQRQMGKEATHMSYSQSSLTPFDSVGMQLAALATIARIATAEETTDLTGISTGFSVVLQGMADKAGPFAGEMLRGVDQAIFNPEATYTPLPPRLRPTERALLAKKDSIVRTVGLGPFFRPSVMRVSGDPEGVTRADRSLVTAMRLLPVLGSEIPYWLDPVLAVGEGYGEAARPGSGAMSQIAAEGLFLARQYSGILKEYAQDPEKSEQYNRDAAKSRTEAKIARLNARQYLRDVRYRDLKGNYTSEDD